MTLLIIPFDHQSHKPINFFSSIIDSIFKTLVIFIYFLKIILNNNYTNINY